MQSSVDSWPGSTARARPPASSPNGGPQAEPSALRKPPVVLKRSASARAKYAESNEELHSPPFCVVGRLAGKLAPLPEFPLCCLGLGPEEVNRLFGRPGCADWQDAEFEIGRAPFDSQYCASWRALFEPFAPVERALAPIYRFLIRARGSLLLGESAPGRADAQAMAFETVSSSRRLGAPPTEFESVLRAYVDDIPASVAPTFAQRDDLIGLSGRLEPLGVIAGVAFAMVTRGSSL